MLKSNLHHAHSAEQMHTRSARTDLLYLGVATLVPESLQTARKNQWLFIKFMPRDTMQTLVTRCPRGNANGYQTKFLWCKGRTFKPVHTELTLHSKSTIETNLKACRELLSSNLQTWVVLHKTYFVATRLVSVLVPSSKSCEPAFPRYCANNRWVNSLVEAGTLNAKTGYKINKQVHNLKACCMTRHKSPNADCYRSMLIMTLRGSKCQSCIQASAVKPA